MSRFGMGYDVHQLVEGRKLIIGGVEIPFEKGLLGHSDADVLLHAISDALLGAAALGDIGKHFPDTDERYKGADSLKLLEEVGRRLPDFPIVLHGSSSVPQEYVQMVNKYGGAMPDAIGIPEEMLRQAAKMAVCKINIDSDLRLCMTAAVRKHLAEHPDHFDPRQYLKDGRDAIRGIVQHKIRNVLGSSNTL